MTTIRTPADLVSTQAYLMTQEQGLAELLSKISPRKVKQRMILALPYVNAILEARADIDRYLGLAEFMPTPKKIDADELRRLATENQKCAQCGERVRQIATGEIDRVALQVTANEAARIAIDVDDDAIRRRTLCALSLIDPDLAGGLRKAMATEASDG